MDEYLYYLGIVLRKLLEDGLTVNRDKCEFCCKQITYLGYFLDKDGLRPNPDEVQPVLDFPVSGAIRQLQRYLRMVKVHS